MERPTRHRWSTAALSVLLSALIGAGPAAALPLPSPDALKAAANPKVAILVVGLDPVAQGEVGRLEVAAEAALSRSGRFEHLRLFDALDPQNATARKTRSSEGEAAVASGRKSYDDLDTAKAAVSFTEAVKAYKQSDLTRHFSDLSTAWVMRIASLVANGETRAAQNEIDKLVSLDPRAEFKSENFPPDSLKQVEDVRKAALSGKNEIEVKTTPAGARVYLNGQLKGFSPLKLSALPTADHFISVQAPGYALAQQPATSGPVDVTLREAEAAAWYRTALDRIAKDPEGPLRDAGAKEFGQRIGADQMLLVLARKSSAGQKLELTLLRLETKDGHNFAYQTLVAPMGDGLGNAVEAPLSALVVKDVPKRGDPVTHFKSKGSGVGKKTVGYVLLGTGAALILGGAFFGLQANGQAGAFHNTVQNDEVRANAFKTTGQTYALMTDLFLLAGIVAAAPGAYLAFGGKDSPAGGTKKDDLPMPPPPKGTVEKTKRVADEPAKRETPAALPEDSAKKEPPPPPKEEPVRREEPPKREEPRREKPLSKKELPAQKEAERKKVEEERKRAEEQKKKDEAQRKADEEKKKAEEEKKKAEEEKKKAEEKKKKKAEEDDLRNY
ncbi:MAG: PEGA domain-containing protein [Myxococcaceae bacterium]